MPPPPPPPPPAPAPPAPPPAPPSPPLNHACAWLMSVTLAIGTPRTDLSRRHIAAKTGSPGSHAFKISSTSADLAASSTGASGYSGPCSVSSPPRGEGGAQEEGGGRWGRAGARCCSVACASVAGRVADAPSRASPPCVSVSFPSPLSSPSAPIAAGSGAETPALAAAAIDASSRALGGLTRGGSACPGYHGLERGDDDGTNAALSATAIEGAGRGIRGGLPDSLRASPAPRSLMLFQ